MGSLLEENGRWRLRFHLHKKRRSLWLGDVSKRTAKGVEFHVDNLVQAKQAGQAPKAPTQKWAADLEGRIKDWLVEWGLVDATRSLPSDDPRRKLEPFINFYIASRTDVKPITVDKYKQTKRMLLEYFDNDELLVSITAGDTHRWKRWMLSREVKAATKTEPAKKMAQATVSKHIKRAKTIFRDAVRDNLLAKSPFADLKGCVEVNQDRQRFVDRATTAAVLKACPDAEWRLIFALPRYAGLRCPTEVCALKWSDILWDQDKIRIDAVKTGLRFCPIFPELKPILEEAYHAAPEGTLYCIGRYGGNGKTRKNFATNLHRIIERAGYKPWPKTFVNLRSTRRTELQEAFPSHVINAWLGQSSKVAEDHYLQVTKGHWAAGATELTGKHQRGPAGGPVSVGSEILGASTENKTHHKTPVVLATDDYSKPARHLQQDSNLQPAA